MTLNIENIKILSAKLKSLSTDAGADKNTLGFNMLSWHHKINKNEDSIIDTSSLKCDTVCCIGGWTNVLFSGVPIETLGLVVDHYDPTEAELALGVGARAGQELFYPSFIDNTNISNKVTPAIAAEVLDNLIETGEVDWKSVLIKNGF